VAFVFMERHWNTVTRRLSAAVVQDVASLIDVYKGYPQDKEPRRSCAASRSGCSWWWISCPSATCPRPAPKPFFSLPRSDRFRCSLAGRSAGRSGSITVGRSNLVEIRIQLDDARDARLSRSAARPMPRIRRSSCSGWWARRRFC